jgi:hypothetical protein
MALIFSIFIRYYSISYEYYHELTLAWITASSVGTVGAGPASVIPSIGDDIFALRPDDCALSLVAIESRAVRPGILVDRAGCSPM